MPREVTPRVPLIQLPPRSMRMPGKIMDSEKEAITRRNRKESPLLRLPAELRNRIYGYAMSGGVTLEDHLLPAELAVAHNPPGASLALPKVCYQLHQETALLLFSLNTFTGSSTTIEDFLDALGEYQKAKIESITVYPHLQYWMIWSDDTEVELAKLMRDMALLKRVDFFVLTSSWQPLDLWERFFSRSFVLPQRVQLSVKIRTDLDD
ncbi:hypothetical protein E8E13_005790 [Curvularia kusanoi]|uniref:Uncharacterized protein n=1 Tax=Curvularia kusanoi TaxID=90978 RepID=A0A9P4TDC6_CURKU|nr:hypothetical protein E8E13_005790 [Curvularia kusanoi]